MISPRAFGNLAFLLQYTLICDATALDGIKQQHVQQELPEQKRTSVSCRRGFLAPRELLAGTNTTVDCSQGFSSFGSAFDSALESNDVHGVRKLEASIPVEAALEGGWVCSTCVFMSLLAGLSTTIGAGVVFIMPGNRVPPAHMAFVLALAGGVMVSASILEFWLPVVSNGSREDVLRVFMYSTIGAVAFLIMSHFIPEPELVESNAVDVEACDAKMDAKQQLVEDVSVRQSRLAVVLMLSLTAHNFPEGFAVAVSSLESRSLGFIIMLAIAMHNIPEGIAISVPVLAATGSRKKALWMSFLSGMAEPVGAMVALFVVQLTGAVSNAALENLLCAVGGVMVAVSLKELFPEAWRQDRHHATIAGTICGFILMLTTIHYGA